MQEPGLDNNSLAADGTWVDAGEEYDEKEWAGWLQEAGVLAWYADADAGRPASHSPPSSPNETPAGKLLSRKVEVKTPVKPTLPIPLAKTQLIAAKKLELSLKNSKKGKAEKSDSEKAAKCVEETDVKGGKSKEKMEKPEDEKSKQGKKNKKKEGQKKPRAKPDGPMMEAMREFVEKKRAKGFGYHESLALWKNSKKRRSILETLSEAEIKRRRYE